MFQIFNNCSKTAFYISSEDFLGSAQPASIYRTVRCPLVRITKKCLKFSEPLLRPDWRQFLQCKCTQDSSPVHKYNCTKHSVYATLGEAKCVRTAFYRVAVIFDWNVPVFVT